MKNLVLVLLNLFIIINLQSQPISQKIKTLTQEQYKEYFPVDMDCAQFVPTTDYVCILPTNEKNEDLQKKVNEFYRQTFIKSLPTIAIPNQISKVITDEQAMREDLSNVNIHAFGTVKGNLWIAQFMKKAKDFPIKIYDDSIIADKIYHGNDYFVLALWYNPDNYKHAVTLHIPQQIEYAKFDKNGITPQYSIWQRETQITSSHYYHLKNNQWYFSENRDTILDYRDIDHQQNNHFGQISQFNYRYPTLEQLKTCLISETDIPIDTIKISDIDGGFRNISDLEWLRPIAQKYKIIDLGEGHHLKYNNYLLKRILFAINTFDYFPTLICELPYSYTAYINYYLSLKGDNDANIYRDTVLVKIYKPFIPIFETIRSWNKLHPQKMILVGCSDIEHYLGKTINFILNPYFKKIDPHSNFQIKPELGKNDSIIYEGQKLIEQAKKQNIIGEYPFQTPEYMESVFENLKSSIPIKLNPKKRNDHTDRYKVMIRNVTDEHFLGKQVSNGKSMFYGGFDHFRILNDGSNKKAILTEGYYLANQYGPTKGKVYAISMITKAISIEDTTQRIDPGLNFNEEPMLINLYKQGKIKLKEPVLEPNNNELDNYIYKLSYKFSDYAIRIKNINQENLLNKYEGFNRFMLFYYLKDISDFNTNIIIPKAPVGD